MEGFVFCIRTLFNLIHTLVSCVNVVIFKVKVGANFKVFNSCPRSFQNLSEVNGKV